MGSADPDGGVEPKAAGGSGGHTRKVNRRRRRSKDKLRHKALRRGGVNKLGVKERRRIRLSRSDRRAMAAARRHHQRSGKVRHKRHTVHREEMHEQLKGLQCQIQQFQEMLKPVVDMKNDGRITFSGPGPCFISTGNTAAQKVPCSIRTLMNEVFDQYFGFHDLAQGVWDVASECSSVVDFSDIIRKSDFGKCGLPDEFMVDMWRAVNSSSDSPAVGEPVGDQKAGVSK